MGFLVCNSLVSQFCSGYKLHTHNQTISLIRCIEIIAVVNSYFTQAFRNMKIIIALVFFLFFADGKSCNVNSVHFWSLSIHSLETGSEVHLLTFKIFLNDFTAVVSHVNTLNALFLERVFHRCIYTVDLVSGSTACALHVTLVSLRMFTFQRRDVFFYIVAIFA